MSEAASEFRRFRIVMLGPPWLHTVRWAKGMADRGHEVAVGDSRLAGQDSRFVDLSLDLPSTYRGLARWLRPLGSLRLARAMQRRILDWSPDVVHKHLLGVGWFDFHMLRGLPGLVISSWGSDVVEHEPFTTSAKRWKRRILALPAHLTATTQFLGSHMSRWSPPDRPITIIPFGVDVEKFSPGAGELPPRPIVVGFVKHLMPIYGPQVLLAALAKAVEQCEDLQAHLVGKGELESELRQQAADLRITDKVQFLGRIDNDAVPDFLRSLHLFAMPSTGEESFGVSAVEAQACGIPVIVSDVGGIPEAVDSGQSALLVPPGDVRALADAIIELARDGRRRQEMGQRGREFVLNHFVWNDCLARMESVYADACR